MPIYVYQSLYPKKGLIDFILGEIRVFDAIFARFNRFSQEIVS